MELTASVSFDSNFPEVAKAYSTIVSNGINAMANDFMRYSHPTTPLLSGALRRSRTKEVVNDNEIRVSWTTPYAAYQERGRRADGSHVVRNYTTPGTGSKYAENALNRIEARKTEYFV